MVSRLSDLADFLQNDALPTRLARDLQERQQEISTTLQKGEKVSIQGPNGEVITIAPTKPTGKP